MGRDQSAMAKPVLLPLLVVAVAMVLEGARQLYTDVLATGVETELSFWSTPDYQPTDTTIARTGAELEHLLQFPPAMPDHLARQAYYFSWQGFFTTNVEQRLAFNQRAVASQYRAMQLRPAYRQGWAEMIEYASRTTGGAQVLELAKLRVADLQPARN